MKKNLAAAASAALIVAFVAPVAQADSISGVVGARARDRQGSYLNGQDREQLRRYGGNYDNGRRYYRGYDNGYYGGPGVGIYIGPGGYYGPYGY